MSGRDTKERDLKRRGRKRRRWYYCFVCGRGGGEGGRGEEKEKEEEGGEREGVSTVAPAGIRSSWLLICVTVCHCVEREGERLGGGYCHTPCILSF
jgi:hypothetical protein